MEEQGTFISNKYKELNDIMAADISNDTEI